MNCAYIFIGTNIDRERNYIEALRNLHKLGKLTRISSVYETAPVGGTGQDFYNGSVLLETRLGAAEVKQALRAVERDMGRVRTEDRNAPRPIDLDLVLYNQMQVDTGELRIPDPLILKRPFLAQTLAELDPEYIHPTTGETLAQIADRLTAGADGMWLEPAMTARVRKLFDEIYTGEVAHA